MTIQVGKEVFLIEEEGLAQVRENLGEEFKKAVDVILNCPTRLVITGIGKSGIIGQKISATLNSTGTPSFFLHPVEALHGDLGMVMPSDVIVAISYSGETSELNNLLTSLKKRGTNIIAMTGDSSSTLAKSADIVLDIAVPQEACPLGLAPTASTTATLAMGDALSVVLLKEKQLTPEDFRKNHPGGSLGERLKVRVDEVMLTGEAMPIVNAKDPAGLAIEILNTKNLGAVLIMGSDTMVEGIVTDGDIRRVIINEGNIAKMNVGDVMTANPIAIKGNMLAADALSIMQRHEITVLPVVDNEEKLVGILHLHNLLGKGEFRFLL